MVGAVQNFPSQKKKLVYIYRYLWIQPWPQPSNKKFRKVSRLFILKNIQTKTQPNPTIKNYSSLKSPLSKTLNLKASFTPLMAPHAAGPPHLPEKRWLRWQLESLCVSSTPHQLLLFPTASWTTQTKTQNRESGFLSHLSVRTKLELNYNYNKTSTAEDDVSQRKQELLVSLESW